MLFVVGDGAGFTGGRSASIFLRSLNGDTNIGFSSCGFGLASRGVDFRFLAIRGDPGVRALILQFAQGEAIIR